MHNPPKEKTGNVDGDAEGTEILSRSGGKISLFKAGMIFRLITVKE
jgi:hypothetical protein